MMGIIYLIPAAAIWILYAILSFIGVPWWIDYPIFGAASAATAVGAFIAIISNGSRF